MIIYFLKNVKTKHTYNIEHNIIKKIKELKEKLPSFSIVIFSNNKYKTKIFKDFDKSNKSQNMEITIEACKKYLDSSWIVYMYDLK